MTTGLEDLDRPRPNRSLPASSSSSSSTAQNSALYQNRTRASCRFCRRRKIRCSGEPQSEGGCTVCQQRQQECIYDPSAPLGRPQKPTGTTASVLEPGLDGVEVQPRRKSINLLTKEKRFARDKPKNDGMEDRESDDEAEGGDPETFRMTAGTEGTYVEDGSQPHLNIPDDPLPRNPSSGRAATRRKSHGSTPLGVPSSSGRSVLPSSQPSNLSGLSQSSQSNSIVRKSSPNKDSGIEDDLSTAVWKLRLSTPKSTFHEFKNASIGTMVTAFFQLLTAPPDSSTNAPAPYLPVGTRALYELAVKVRTVKQYESRKQKGRGRGKEARRDPLLDSNSSNSVTAGVDANSTQVENVDTHTALTRKIRTELQKRRMFALRSPHHLWQESLIDIVHLATAGPGYQYHFFGQPASSSPTNTVSPDQMNDTYDRDQTANPSETTGTIHNGEDHPDSASRAAEDDDDLEAQREPYLIQLLLADESKPFHFVPGESPSISNPLETLTKDMLKTLIMIWFQNSPYCFVLNDKMILGQIERGTYDAALICVVIGVAITTFKLKEDQRKSTSGPSQSGDTSQEEDQSTTHQPTSLPPSAFSRTLVDIAHSTILHLDADLFLDYGRRVLFSRKTAEAKNSLSTLQGLLILSGYLGTQLLARNAWSLMGTCYSIAKETLQMVREKRSKQPFVSEIEAIEDEQLVCALWTFAIWGCWGFLALDLPRSTLLDVTDSLPLPPISHSESLSYRYRQSGGDSQRFQTCDHSLETTIRVFHETCRSLSLIISLSIRQPGVPTPAEILTSSASMGPLTSNSLGAINIAVAKWLMQCAEEYVTTPFLLPNAIRRNEDLPVTPAPTSDSSKSSSSTKGSAEADRLSNFTAAKLKSQQRNASFLMRSDSLACVHAIMSLHQLTPFNEPMVDLSTSAFSLALQAIGLLNRVVACQTGPHSDINPRLIRVNPSTRLNRLVKSALPYCIRILNHLAEKARDPYNLASDTSYLVWGKQAEILRILEEMVRFRASLVFSNSTASTANIDPNRAGDNAGEEVFGLVGAFAEIYAKTDLRPPSLPTPPRSVDFDYSSLRMPSSTSPLTTRDFQNYAKAATLNNAGRLSKYLKPSETESSENSEFNTRTSMTGVVPTMQAPALSFAADSMTGVVPTIQAPALPFMADYTTFRNELIDIMNLHQNN